LADAIGKYEIYRLILNSKKSDEVLFLAVPTRAYMGILNERLGRMLIHDLRIKYLVFDAEKETVTEWIG
jgi:hypothetical protein